MRICINVPEPESVDFDKAYDTLSHRNIIDLVQRSLSSDHGTSDPGSRSWKAVIGRELQAGKKLELAWRFGGQLDWVWQEQDVEGNPRPWAVLSGLSLWQVRLLPYFRIGGLICTIDLLGTEASSARATHCRAFPGFHSPSERQENI